MVTGRGPGRGGYVAFGALIALVGSAALGAARADAGRGMPTSPAGGAMSPGSVVAAPSGPSSTGTAPEPDAAGFLAAVSGTPPTACALVVRTLGNRWGSGSVRPRVRVPLGEAATDRTLAEWSWSATPTGSDTEALLDGLGAADPCARRVAATLLARGRDPGVRDRLRRLVETGRGTERLAALTALAGQRDPASSALLGRLLTDTDPEVRQSAAWGLGEMEARSSRHSLETALRDREVGVRVNAAWALGRIEDPAAISALSELLASDPVAEVRSAAAWALGRIEG